MAEDLVLEEDLLDEVPGAADEALPRLVGRAAMELRERSEALRHPADDPERERKAQRTCPHRRLGRAAHGDPNGQRVLHGSG